MKLALFQPDIPQNTGAMIRICACFDVGIDIIHPTGYVFNQKNIKQVAMDYLSSVSLNEHDSWNNFLEANKGNRIILLSTKGKIKYSDFNFKNSDSVLVGRESAGVPNEVYNSVNEVITIPMSQNARSLNVAVSAGIVLAEARRQLVK
jgi:tRNA (cytidine/uridine-2'-O-)-methyltransferase